MITHEDFATPDPVMVYVYSEMSEEQRQQIIKDHAIFQKQGFIGESVLRSVANDIRAGRDYISITTCMDWVCTSVYQYYTMNHFNVI